MKASSIAIKRHVKIRKEARLYDPNFFDYFSRREKKKRGKEKLYHYCHISDLNLFGMGKHSINVPARS